MSFHIIKGDITKVKADAIVNMANPNPTYGNGVDHAGLRCGGVRAAAGKQKANREN